MCLPLLLAGLALAGIATPARAEAASMSVAGTWQTLVPAAITSFNPSAAYPTKGAFTAWRRARQVILSHNPPDVACRPVPGDMRGPPHAQPEKVTGSRPDDQNRWAPDRRATRRHVVVGESDPAIGTLGKC